MAIGTIGKYERLDVLGHGASGVVYLAWDTLLRRNVALKEIRAAGPEMERVLDEARVLDRLRHPHIIEVHSVDHQNGVILIDMELVRGRNLAEILRARGGEPLPPAEALRIALAVLDALAYAHERRILHRDVKPANILIGADGNPIKLTDFGLAEALGSHSVAGGGGTYPYMAPEDFAEDAASDYRSDLWAVGVMLYEMLTGRRPFAVNQPKNPFAWEKAIREETPTPPSQLQSALPAALDPVVARALAKDKTARFPNARAFADALRAAAGDLAPADAAPLPTASPAPAAEPSAPTPIRVDEPGKLTFPDGAVADSLDSLLSCAARNWDFSRRALGDGRVERFLRQIGEVYIAELAQELAARADLSSDRKLREFLERSQPEPAATPGGDDDDHTAPLRRRPRLRLTPAPVPAEAPRAPEPPAPSKEPPKGGAEPLRMRWWFPLAYVACLAPAIAAALFPPARAMGHSANTMLAALSSTGILSAMLLLVGIGIHLPVWARAISLPPMALGTMASGVLAFRLVGNNPTRDDLLTVSAEALLPLGILLIQAVYAQRLWRLWLGVVLFLAGAATAVFASLG